MTQIKKVAVTGAFSYTGKYIARHLLAQGHQVMNLTRDPNRRSDFGDQLHSVPFNFDNPAALVTSLKGCTTLINTYWIRFNYKSWTFDQAVQNTGIMLQAARQAGVQRFVHISVSNPTPDSPLAYFRGKARLESMVQDSGLSYAIIRPTLIFGKEDLLLNNIAFLLRKYPLFPIPGKGEYRLQPVSAEETAELCAWAGEQNQNLVMDAAGPEVMTFHQLVQMIATQIGKAGRLVSLPAPLSLYLSKLVGRMVGDIPLTREEMEGLMSELLVSHETPIGKTRFEDWLKENIQELGMNYVSELKRNYLPYMVKVSS